MICTRGGLVRLTEVDGHVLGGDFFAALERTVRGFVMTVVCGSRVASL